MSKHKPFDFLLKNDNLKLCSICGLEKKLTFEHMPPKSSGNIKPINITGLENMTHLGGYLYGKFKKSPKGMGGFKLCETCNNLTGSWYGESYIDLSNQFNKVINENIGNKNVEFVCKIKPLNFLKQAVCLLLCADQATGILREKIKETNFILEKEEKKLSEDICITKNITLETTSLAQGFTSSWDSNNGFTCNIKFIHRPFNFKATFDSNEVYGNSVNLIPFSRYNYNEEIELKYKINLDKLILTLINV